MQKIIMTVDIHEQRASYLIIICYQESAPGRGATAESVKVKRVCAARLMMRFSARREREALNKAPLTFLFDACSKVSRKQTVL